MSTAAALFEAPAEIRSNASRHLSPNGFSRCSKLSILKAPSSAGEGSSCVYLSAWQFRTELRGSVTFEPKPFALFGSQIPSNEVHVSLDADTFLHVRFGDAEARERFQVVLGSCLVDALCRDALAPLPTGQLSIARMTKCLHDCSLLCIDVERACLQAVREQLELRTRVASMVAALQTDPRAISRAALQALVDATSRESHWASDAAVAVLRKVLSDGPTLAEVEVLCKAAAVDEWDEAAGSPPWCPLSHPSPTTAVVLSSANEPSAIAQTPLSAEQTQETAPRHEPRAHRSDAALVHAEAGLPEALSVAHAAPAADESAPAAADASLVCGAGGERRSSSREERPKRTQRQRKAALNGVALEALTTARPATFVDDGAAAETSSAGGRDTEPRAEGAAGAVGPAPAPVLDGAAGCAADGDGGVEALSPSLPAAVEDATRRRVGDGRGTDEREAAADGGSTRRHVAVGAALALALCCVAASWPLPPPSQPTPPPPPPPPREQPPPRLPFDVAQPTADAAQGPLVAEALFTATADAAVGGRGAAWVAQSAPNASDGRGALRAAGRPSAVGILKLLLREWTSKWRSLVQRLPSAWFARSRGSGRQGAV
eukprot:gene14340-10242_t